MDTVRVVSYIAIFCAGVTILGCVIIVPSLYAEISNVWQEIDEEMAQFRVESDALWREMQQVSGGARWRRQVAIPSATPQGPAPVSLASSGAAGVGLGAAAGAGPQAGAAAAPVAPAGLGSNCNCNANNNCPPGKKKTICCEQISQKFSKFHRGTNFL